MHARPQVLRWTLVGLWSLVLAAVLVFTATFKAQTTPTLTIVSPADGTIVDRPVTVRVEHSGIIFDGTKIGQAPEPGVGHWHINIDGKFAGLAVSNVVEIPNDAFPTIPAGPHTIMVNLHENNHADTTPPVQESFQINLSKELSLGGAAPGSAGVSTSAGAAGAGPTTAGHAGPGVGTTAPGPELRALPNTGMPAAGENRMHLTRAMWAVLACSLLGSLLVYWSRAGRRRGGPGR